MFRRTVWMVPLVLLLAVLCFPLHLQPLFAEESSPEASETMITMDFQEVDLPVLIKFISELTGKNFIVDEKVKGKKVTVISPTKISKDEAYAVFESILDIKGLTTVPAGKVIKILPTKEATAQSLKTVVGKEKVPATDTMITRLVPLEHVNGDEMVKILKPLMSRDSQIDAYGPTNTLIITDTASNIVRLMRILKQLDVESDEMIMEVIPLEYASAEVMADQLQDIVQTLNAPPTSTTPSATRRTPRSIRSRRTTQATTSPGEFTGKIISDDRTNSLIILSTKSQLEQIRELVRKLDYDTPRAYGNINVYYLEYSNAEDTAKVLNDLVSGAQTLSSAATKRGTAATTTSPLLARTMASFEGEVSITADVATNSLILVASPRDYQTLKNVIQKLDIRRKQVYVEAVIMEVSPNFLQDLGFEFRGGVPLEGGDVVDNVLLGGSNFSQGTDNMFQTLAGLSGATTGTGTSTATTTSTSLFPMVLGSQTGLTLGAVFDRIKIPGPNGEDIFLPANLFLLHALQSKGRSNILSTPHLIAIDNEEAEIVVGRNVPFITSTSQTTVSTVQQVQRENVGITLRFTPQITEGDYIQLELYQEISALISSPIGQDVNTVGPTTSTRKATNSVLVRDGQTIVVGGLMEDRITREKSMVPWLGEIPLLGWFFRYEKDTVDKSNLMIFLTPTIVREDQDVQKVFEEKKNNMIEYKKRHGITDKYEDIKPFAPKQVPPDVQGLAPSGTNIGEVETGHSRAPEGVQATLPEYTVTIKGARPLDSPAPEAVGSEEKPNDTSKKP